MKHYWPIVSIVVVGAALYTRPGYAQMQPAPMANPAPAASPAMAPMAVPVTPPESVGPATGFLVQARMQTQTSLLSIFGGPGFLLGYQGNRFAAGLGLGLTRLGVSSGDTSVALTMYQIAPTVLFDVWQSTDGRARANLIGSVGYGRASYDVSDDTQSCFYDPNTGVDDCTTEHSKSTGGATLIPVTLGFGGDYFLNRNFALGAEAGFQGTFVTGVDSKSNGASENVDAGADSEAMYGVIRATLVLGN